MHVCVTRVDLTTRKKTTKIQSYDARVMTKYMYVQLPIEYCENTSTKYWKKKNSIIVRVYVCVVACAFVMKCDK